MNNVVDPKIFPNAPDVKDTDTQKITADCNHGALNVRNTTYIANAQNDRMKRHHALTVAKTIQLITKDADTTLT